MKRRCLRCRTLIASGSYCQAHKPRPRDPDRIRGRRGQQIRAWALAAGGYCCAACGAAEVALEVHHRDHDPANNAPANLRVLCKPCHARAGLGARPFDGSSRP
jgi:5-methylcytosine-specific restriction endonuclease McrA